MNKGKFTKPHMFILFPMILFLVFLLFDVLIIRMEYGNYQDKIRILCRMLSEEDTVGNAAGILKDYADGKENKADRKAEGKAEGAKAEGKAEEAKAEGKAEEAKAEETKVEEAKAEGTKAEGTKAEEVKADIGEKLLESYGYNLEKDNALYQVFWRQSVRTVLFSALFYVLCISVAWGIRFCEKRKRSKDIHRLEALLSRYKNQEFSMAASDSITIENKEIEKLYSDILSFGDYLKLLNEQVTLEKEATKSLVTDISHQLKTPVAALKTSFEILQREDLDQKDKKEFTDRCSLQLKGIESLLEALINISRLEAGMIAIKPENTGIFETILDAVNRVYLKAREKEIRIEMDAEEDLQKITLPHDKKWLSEALINILDNGIKYSGENTCILIRMMKRTTFFRIEIEDQGIGIPKSEYNQIFKRFYRGSSKEVSGQPGSGVGLYLTREIISRHKGTIRVSSGKKGTGSNFIIQLPYCS